LRAFSSMTPVTVLAVDHRERFRRAARELVAATPGFTWLADAASAEEALEAGVELRPELVLVESAMPGIDGREAAQLLRQALSSALVIVLSMNGNPDFEGLTPGGLRALWERHRHRPD
jgi:DNA-binding NarL/FixJ family response regulator